jgi:hypothetical protein
VWELRDGDGAVAEVDLERHLARSPAGAWHIESVGRGLVARPADTQNVTAAYYPRRIRMGGSIVLSEDDWFTLVRNPFTNGWRVLDRDGNERLRLEWCKPIGSGRLATPIELSIVISSKPNEDVAITVTTLFAVYVVFTQPGIVPTALSG